MKIGILTYYGVFNHGAVLQANALRTVVKSLGHECDFIQFTRNYDMIPQEHIRKYSISLKSIALYTKYLMKKGLRNTVYNLKKNAVLRAYRKTHLPLGVRYNEFTGDIAIIGSDEVFSIEIGINPFFYGHGLKAKRVISYAGSFGPSTLASIKACREEHLISSGLQSMNMISTRDQNSADIVQSLTGHKPVLVCDPVILYGYKNEMAENQPDDHGYIIIYSYENNFNQPDEVNSIREYARKYGLKIYSAAYYHGWCDKNLQVTPDELLGWIKSAALVVTDTFHGAVLSIVCNTPMVVKVRGNRNKLEYLMNEYGLADRMIGDFNDFARTAECTINFEQLNSIVEMRREASMQYLIHALKS